VEQFVQLSDLPQDRGLASHLKCLNALATAIAEAGGARGMQARGLLQHCREAEGLLHQRELAELSAGAAQAEKEQLQAIFRSASDESAHLMTELTAAAEAARRTAVRLRGRETGGWEVLRGTRQAAAAPNRQPDLQLLPRSCRCCSPGGSSQPPTPDPLLQR
jgi:hypothetical protein